MRLTKHEIIIAGVVLLSFAVGGYFYPQMPERIASHWNVQGQADGYMSKFWGLFLMPFISVGLSLLLVLVPKIDPLKANIERFKKHYYGFVILVLLFLLYLYLLTIFWNLGIKFNMIQLLAPAFGILFYCCGILIEKAKRNWFIYGKGSSSSTTTRRGTTCQTTNQLASCRRDYRRGGDSGTTHFLPGKKGSTVTTSLASSVCRSHQGGLSKCDQDNGETR